MSDFLGFLMANLTSLLKKYRKKIPGFLQNTSKTFTSWTL
jgi:hypothetical protein